MGAWPLPRLALPKRWLMSREVLEARRNLLVTPGPREADPCVRVAAVPAVEDREVVAEEHLAEHHGGAVGRGHVDAHEGRQAGALPGCHVLRVVQREISGLAASGAERVCDGRVAALGDLVARGPGEPPHHLVEQLALRREERGACVHDGLRSRGALQHRPTAGRPPAQQRLVADPEGEQRDGPVVRVVHPEILEGAREEGRVDAAPEDGVARLRVPAEIERKLALGQRLLLDHVVEKRRHAIG
mmetsp:Transcript_77179/g.201137  ORF Transcript_77179/g.201137 Transcript_77179/m.201137 type:complete len:244 (+) Transcript_77179:256-987(+)